MSSAQEPSPRERPAYERGTGFLLARLGSLVARSWGVFLGEHGLTQSQYTLLVALDEQGPVGQRQLARLVAVDARNVVAVLDALAARDLIERRAHEGDRRRRVVLLTAAGRALVAAVAGAANAEEDRLLRALSARDRTRLNHLLRQVYASEAAEERRP
ncbi:MarR family transcriptional regulator [Streptomyces tubbatahanensis]|uniref:MarR family transcriptional regulator n=1 Tax=Streptomyces tubbatahanensis TaxID=2923272 RepID=A0ABY3XNK9_9ACTN|nr:MarR family transcriptional regulator [Streptomyces tubbatahanensis]UNS95999.1 MarR family transcriptional regulator [Streptomyces tubbatahanensis]